MSHRAVIHNIALAFNVPNEEDANIVAAEVIEAVNQILRQSNIGVLEPYIVSSKHPVSMVVDHDCRDDEALALNGID